MVTLFHHVDTRWADSLLEELNLYDPAEALFMLEMLLDKAEETPDLLKDVFARAVDPFVRFNLTAYRSELTALAMRNEALRQWFIRTIFPWTDDPEAWADMIKKLNSKR